MRKGSGKGLVMASPVLAAGEGLQSGSMEGGGLGFGAAKSCKKKAIAGVGGKRKR